MEHDFYARYAEVEGRHWWFVGRRRIFLRLLENRLPDRRPLDILDFGCGTGAFVEHLGRFGSVVAVDGDADAVRFARDRGCAAVHHAVPGESLPFADATFDLVTALDVVEHIDDDVAVLRELRRVLRPGGQLLVAVPAFMFLWGDQDEISHHRRRYTATTLEAALVRAGYTVEHHSYLNTFMFLPVAAVRLGRRLVRAPSAERTDFDTGPAWLNGMLSTLFSAEARLACGRGLPFGVSVLALARPQRDPGA